MAKKRKQEASPKLQNVPNKKQKVLQENKKSANNKSKAKTPQTQGIDAQAKNKPSQIESNKVNEPVAELQINSITEENGTESSLAAEIPTTLHRKRDEAPSSRQTENLDEKRLKEAKKLVERLKQLEEAAEKFAPLEPLNRELDPIALRLQQQAEEAEGRLKKTIAQRVQRIDLSTRTKFFRGHKNTVTCVCLTEDEKFAYTGGKDCCIIKWNLESGEKTVFKGKKIYKNNTEQPQVSGHKDHILSIAVSSDGKFVASSGLEHTVYIWDTASNSLVDQLKGHRGSVTGLVFRKNTHELYTCSCDRTVKIWNIDEMAYVDSLYGHQDEVMAVDSMYEERAVTCGKDKSIRLWKVQDETQLLFQGGQIQSIDCISLFNEELFVSGSQDGSVALWSSSKKKPGDIALEAHGGSWVSAVSALKHSDLCASGSGDGNLNLWKADAHKKILTKVNSLKLDGWINGIDFSRDGKFMVAAVGQEHKLGRWFRTKEAKNGIYIVRLDLETGQQQ